MSPDLFLIIKAFAVLAKKTVNATYQETVTFALQPINLLGVKQVQYVHSVQLDILKTKQVNACRAGLTVNAAFLDCVIHV